MILELYPIHLDRKERILLLGKKSALQYMVYRFHKNRLLHVGKKKKAFGHKTTFHLNASGVRLSRLEEIFV